MRNILLGAVGSMALLSSTANAADIVNRTVKIFNDGAWIEEVWRVDESDKGKLVIRELPSSVEGKDITIKTSDGIKGYSALFSRHSSDIHKELSSSEKNKLESRLLEIDTLLKENNDLLRSTEGMIAFVMKAEYDESSVKHLEDLYNKRRNINQKIRILTEEVAKINEQLIPDWRLKVDQKRRVIVNPEPEKVKAFSVDFAGEGEIVIGYPSRRLNWSVRYSGLTSSSTTDLILQSEAIIQNAGIAVDDANISLTTASLFAEQWLPAPAPMLLKFQEMEERAYLSRPMAKMSIMADAGEESVSTPQKLNVVSADSFSTEYVISGKKRIEPGDGNIFKMNEIVFDNVLSTKYFPSQNSKALVVANIKNDTAGAIMPGKVSWYRDDRRIGAGYLRNSISPGESKELALYEDKEIIASVKQSKDFENETGVFRVDTELLKDWKINIENASGYAKEVIVVNNLPVSGHDDIQVEFIGDKPDRKNSNGIAEWNITIPAKSSKIFTYGWKVSWPEGKNIRGF